MLKRTTKKLEIKIRLKQVNVIHYIKDSRVTYYGNNKSSKEDNIGIR
jgi:hypothetical protein